MNTKVLNITNGDAFNVHFLKTFGGEAVPFREAMMDGETVTGVYSDDFVKVRASELGVSIEAYRANMAAYDALNGTEYTELGLWFGKDTFCQMNLLTLLSFLEEIGYLGKIILNYIDDETYDVLEENISVELYGYRAIYETVFIKRELPSEVGVLDLNAIELYFDYHSDNGTLANMVRENSDKDEMALICLLLEASKKYGLSDIQAMRLIGKYK